MRVTSSFISPLKWEHSSIAVNHPRKVTDERMSIIGTKIPAILSAIRWMGACSMECCVWRESGSVEPPTAVKWDTVICTVQNLVLNIVISPTSMTQHKYTNTVWVC